MDRYIRDDLADILLGIEYDNLPEDVIAFTKRVILDTMACVMGGYDGPPTKIVRGYVDLYAASGESTVLCDGGKTNRVLATFANGTALRYLDHNDYCYRRDPSHASGNIAAALAVAEAEGLSGRDVILGTVVGYEMQLRLNHHCGSTWERGWASATNLAMSGAALTSKLMGLDATQTANAIAVAGSHNNTLTESKHGNIPMLKATSEPYICKSGVEAALMAARGLTGPEQIFEGRWGWIPVIAGKADVEAFTTPINDHYMITETCLKPYAAEMMTQSSIQASIDLVTEYEFDPLEAKHIEARYHDFALKKPSWDPKKFDPQDRETADHSFPYCIAVSLLDRACGAEQFTDQKLQDSDVRTVMSKIELTVDDSLTELLPEKFGTAIKVTMPDGTEFEKICETPPGHPENPMSDSEIEAKFRRLSRHLMNADQMDRAITACWNIDQCEDLGAFTALFTV